MRDITRFLGRLVVDAAVRPSLRRYTAALVLPLVALLITALITPFSRAPYFAVFLLAVLLSSIYGGRNPGLLTVAVSVFINVLISPPSWSLRVASSDDVVRVLVFAIVGSVIALFTGSTGELQRRLELERQRLSITLRSIGDAVIATDAEGKITFMNWAAEQATGWPLENAAGLALHKVFRIVNEASRAPMENPVRKVLETGLIMGLANHTILLRPDGTEIPIDDSAAPIRDSRGIIVGVVLVFRDITQAKMNQAALMRAEKLATVGKLASTIAHEINNPLEAVSNLLFLLSEDASICETAKGRVEMAQSELARAAEIAKQTLSFYSAATVRTRVNLREVVDAIFRFYASRAAGRAIELKNEVDVDVAIHAIPSQIRQLVTNLVSNAMDAMDEGGTLRVTAEMSRTDGSDKVRINFSDTGHGIPAANLKVIFEPFFTTKEHVGTGLGLWVAKRIVAEHHGDLLVESNTDGNRGTIFTVVLPHDNVAGAANIR